MSELRKKVIMEVEATSYIPEIGQKVYLIYGNSLFVEKVHSVGERSFIIASFKENTRRDYWEWYYKDFGKRWFWSFKDASEVLMSRFGDDYELVKYEEEWYEVERL